MSEGNWFTFKFNDHEGPDVPEILSVEYEQRVDVWKTDSGDIKITMSRVGLDFPLLSNHKSLTISRKSAERFAEAILDIAYG
jgi:hypothetical protein